jgi:hypothetical protein
MSTKTRALMAEAKGIKTHLAKVAKGRLKERKTDNNQNFEPHRALIIEPVHGPLTKGRITQRFLSEGVMETFLTKMFILAPREG